MGLGGRHISTNQSDRHDGLACMLVGGVSRVSTVAEVGVDEGSSLVEPMNPSHGYQCYVCCSSGHAARAHTHKHKQQPFSYPLPQPGPRRSVHYMARNGLSHFKENPFDHPPVEPPSIKSTATYLTQYMVALWGEVQGIIKFHAYSWPHHHLHQVTGQRQ